VRSSALVYPDLPAIQSTSMSTEDINPRYADLDVWDNLTALRAFHEDQLAAVAAVGPALPAIAAAADDAVPRLRQGGRLIYVGAGTSARIGVQDGAELFPTFNWPKEQVAFSIAGGEPALLQAIENAEDSAADGAARIAGLQAGPNDVVIGLAASGSTPFTVGAVKAAGDRGAMTVGISSVAGSPLLAACDHPILVETGAEPIAGSTRLKAGTAQKVVLNMFSTLVMVRLGKVYRGLMVHMRPTNEKLRRRAARMVVTLTGCTPDVATSCVARTDGDVKLAVLLARGIAIDAAKALIDKHKGDLRAALAEIGRT
jgi:N-acetylmuramic acid 6-phosphate etherase